VGRFLKSMISGGLGTVVVLLVLVALVWLGGEYFKWSHQTRILLSGAILAVWLIFFGVSRLIAARRARAIEAQLRAQAMEQVAAAPEDLKAQIQDLEREFWSSVHSLRKSRLGKSAFYSLPWYVMLGPPGSGKSTALLESELNFPSLGQGPKGVRGVGGTRNCDWWFTEEGIFLDTAGRYTTEIDDQPEWHAFLELLRKTRRYRPVNGAIITVDAAGLLRMNAREIEDYAQIIRDRLDELTQRLQIVFPTYVVFTKCDLIAGFCDFFEGLDRAARGQVWGCTLPLASDPETPSAQVYEEKVRPLYEKLCDFRVKALAAEQPEEKRRNIILFPLRFAASQDAFRDFLVALFRPNPFHESALFRGFYFTSATQTGAEIDPLEPADGAAPPLPPEEPAAEPKSFFLNRLFANIILPDKTIVRTSAKVSKRSRWLRSISRVASLSLVAFVGISLGVSFFGNRMLLKDSREATESLLAAEGDGTTPAAAELPALDSLRERLARFDDHTGDGVPWRLHWGLYRGRKIAKGGRNVYFRRLGKRVLSPTVALIEANLRDLKNKPKKNLDDYDRLYRTYQAYMMLAGKLEPKPEILRQVLTDEDRWYACLPAAGGGNPRVREKLLDRQLDFFLNQTGRVEEWRIDVDDVLAASVRKELAEAMWISETYRDLIAVARDDFPPIDLDFLYRGPHADLFLLENRFSTIYTEKGWNEYVRHAIVDQSDVLSAKYADLGIVKDAELIERRIRANFLTDYLQRWTSLLETTRIRPCDSLQDAAGLLRDLSGPDSPFPAFIEAVRKNQVLHLSPTETANEPKGDLKWLPDALKVLAELQTVVDGFVDATRPGRRVVTTLREEKLEPLVQALRQARTDLKKVCIGADPSEGPRLEKFIGQALDRTREALAREAQTEMENLWASLVYDMFRAQFRGRYPFLPDATEEVTASAFSRLMNPTSGILWEIFAPVDKLRNTVIDGRPLVVTSGDFDRAMRHAEAIRDAMYAPDARVFSVKFWVTLKQHAGVRDVRFRLSDHTFALYDRPDRRGVFNWTEEGTGNAKVAISVGLDQWVERETKGPWGLLRLVNAGNPRSLDPGGMFECEWTLHANILGRIETFKVGVLFEPAVENDLFKETFFSRFRPPEKIGP
jgi:type VI secretion system protein ImpL